MRLALFIAICLVSTAQALFSAGFQQFLLATYGREIAANLTRADISDKRGEAAADLTRSFALRLLRRRPT